MSIEAMKQALEALEAYQFNGSVQLFDVSVTTLRQAIAKAEKQDGDCQHCGGKGCVACDAREQEPFGYINRDEIVEHMGLVSCGTIYKYPAEGRLALYIHPPKREWVGLTSQEYDEIYAHNKYVYDAMMVVATYLKRKNT